MNGFKSGFYHKSYKRDCRAYIKLFWIVLFFTEQNRINEVSLLNPPDNVLFNIK